MIININNPPLHVVEISRQGENEFREIVIDVSEWLAEYPDGKISVIYCRPDGELYPVIVNATESPITWRPTATDTAVSGVGAIEVRIQIGDVLGKSCTIEANVLGALVAPGDTPAAPAPDWAQTVADDAARAEAAREVAEEAAELAEKAVGNAQFASFTVADDGHLYMETSDNYETPIFALNNGRLEMTIT